MKLRLFGTDGVRGRAGRELTAELAFRLGRAAARVLGPGSGAEGARVLLGRDTRASGPWLEEALAAGLAAGGLGPASLGVAPTPAVAHLVPRAGFALGAVVSASHNPAEYNGIKFLDGAGRKLAQAVEASIERELGAPGDWGETKDAGGGGLPLAPDRLRADALLELYLEHLVDAAGGRFAGERVALDCANGAAFRTAPEAFRRAGLRVTSLHDRPDGENINRGAGSEHPGALAALVREGRFACGFAFDGDGDRCLAVDERGEIVDGDGLLAILALDLHERGRLPGPAVVGTVMTNLGLERFLARHGIALVRAPVGDREVAEAMEAGGFRLGGEPSGHIVVRDFAVTGDGALTALRVLDTLRRSGRTLGEAARLWERLPQALRNVRLPEGARIEDDERDALAALQAKAGRALSGRGRVVVRPSGTEPVVRILVEGEDEGEVRARADEIAQDVARELERSARARAARASRRGGD